MQHRNAELLAVQNKLSKLQGKLEAETERLLSDRLNVLNVAKEELFAVEGSIVTSKKDFLEKRASQEHIIASNQIGIEGLEHIRDALTSECGALAETRNTLTSDIKALDEDAQCRAAAKQALELSISALLNEEVEFKRRIGEFEERVSDWTERLKNVEAEYGSKSKDKQQTVRLLDAKILDMRQELEQSNLNDKLMQGNLAARVHALDEREKNLRIREAKVEMAEDKIVNNANLLNL